MSGAPHLEVTGTGSIFIVVTVHNRRFVTQFLECHWIHTVTLVKRVRGNEDLDDSSVSDSFGILNITSRHQDADTL